MLGDPNISHSPLRVHNDPQQHDSREFGLARFFRVGGFRGVNGDGRADAGADTEDAFATPSTFARTVAGTFARSHSRAITVANPATRPGSARGWSRHALRVSPGHVQLHGREFQFRRTQQGRLHGQDRRDLGDRDRGRSELCAREGRKRATRSGKRRTDTAASPAVGFIRVTVELRKREHERSEVE